MPVERADSLVATLAECCRKTKHVQDAMRDLQEAKAMHEPEAQPRGVMVVNRPPLPVVNTKR